MALALGFNRGPQEKDPVLVKIEHDGEIVYIKLWFDHRRAVMSIKAPGDYKISRVKLSELISNQNTEEEIWIKNQVSVE